MVTHRASGKEGVIVINAYRVPKIADGFIHLHFMNQGVDCRAGYSLSGINEYSISTVMKEI